MTAKFSFHRVVALSATIVLLSGCSAFEEFMAPLGGADRTPTEQIAQLPPPAERPKLAPISRNHFVLESPQQTLIGEPQIVFASEENTFSDLAREYGLGYDELVDANPAIDPWLPGEGSMIVLPTQYVLPDVPRDGIILNIASKRLFYFPPAEEGQPQTVMTYPIGIGRVGWETPLGSSAVVSKARDPSWYVPASVRKEHEELGDPLPAIVGPGPDNPLGRHVLKLGIPGYLIHGTNQPYGVGMRVSHGCVRLYPENIEFLYDLVAIGAPVHIINEPYLAGIHAGQLYFESHSPLEDDKITVENRMIAALGMVEGLASENDMDFDLAKLRLAVQENRGVPVVLSGFGADNLAARARVVENTVQPDPDMPTLEEVRALLDESVNEAGNDDAAAPDEASVVND